MEQEVIKQVVESSPETKAIFKDLSSRKRFSTKTDLTKVYYDLCKETPINKDAYFDAVKKLQEAGLGSVIYGRGKGKRTRFRWHYNLKDIIAVATGQTVDQIRSIKRGPGRPPKNPLTSNEPSYTKVIRRKRNLPIEQQEPGSIKITFEVPKDLLAKLFAKVER